MRAIRVFSFRTLGFFIAALTFIVVSMYLYVYAYMPAHADDSIGYWANRISLVGSERAYDEFKIFVQNDKASEQHEKAHRFGAALFKTEGLSGIRACDDRFWFGCFHYFVAAAVVEYGLSAIPEIMKNCTNQDGPSYPCYHGVGHGIMLVSGFDVAGVETALSYCRDMTDDVGYHCMYGVFMEFNSRNFSLDLASDSAVVQPVGNPYGVCDNLTSPTVEERMWCIASLPQWWSTRGNIEKEQQGTWCAGLEVREESDTCFQAVGKTTLFVEEPTANKTHSLCKDASVDHRSYVLCVSGAYKLSLSHTDMLEESPEKFCELFEEAEDRESCKHYIQPEWSWWSRFYDAL